MVFFIKGILVSISLIVAIGSQNLFVLKQGIQKNNILYVVSICFLCDFILMSVGVLGLGSIVAQSQIFFITLSLLGAGFLFLYGLNAFISAYKGENTLIVSDSNDDFKKTIKKSVLMTLTITLLNPHVYIDTVLVIGSISAGFSLYQKIMFLTGALLSSFIWFFGLGYGSRLLITLFRKPLTWKILDAFIGIIMWWIAFHLLYAVFS